MIIGVKGLLGALYLKDLAQKTMGGQAGVIRDDRHNGRIHNRTPRCLSLAHAMLDLR
jgi:hypothetical protein